jgi:hypothetical protein
MSYGSGTVNMLTTDSNGRPYCYTMHNVKYAPSAGVRLYAAESERLAGVHMQTSTVTQARPDGTHIPFVVRHSHYWNDGVVIHRARDPILPLSLSVSSTLRKVKVVLRTARLALQCGMWGCHADGGGPEAPVRSDGIVAPRKGGSQPAPKGGGTIPPDPAPQATPAVDTFAAPVLPRPEPLVPPQQQSLLPPTVAPTVVPAPVSQAKTTIPFIEMFVGIGSASHYLKEWFHPVAAFDSDADARTVFSKFSPDAVLTTNFNNMLAGGDGEGAYKHAAKTARVAFSSPPCSNISVVNVRGSTTRDESSAEAKLVVDTVCLLQDGALEVMIIESTPNLVAALGGKLYSEVQAVAASLPTLYILAVAACANSIKSPPRDAPETPRTIPGGVWCILITPAAQKAATDAFNGFLGLPVAQKSGMWHWRRSQRPILGRELAPSRLQPPTGGYGRNSTGGWLADNPQGVPPRPRMWGGGAV